MRNRFSSLLLGTLGFTVAGCSRLELALTHPQKAWEDVRREWQDTRESVSQRDPVQKILRPLPSLYSPTEEQARTSVEKVNATYYFLVGAHLSEKGKAGEALVAFDQLKKIDSESSEVYFHLAKELLKKGLMTEGVAAARKSLELNPKNKEAKLFLANLFATAKKYADAVRLFEEVAKENPDDEDVMLYLALIETETKQTDRALKRIRGFLANNPESALAHYYLGRLQQEKGQSKDAEASYRKAIDIRPGFVQAGTFLGFLQEESGDRQGAIETYSWLAGQTDDLNFHKKLGHLLLDDNQYKGALKSFENYERLDKTDLNNKLKIALVHLELKEFDDASTKLKEILSESPDSDNVRYYLAAVYEQKGDVKKALSEYARITPASKLYFEATKRQIYALARGKNYADGKKLLDKVRDQIGHAKIAELAPTKASAESAPSLGDTKESPTLEDVYEIGVNFYESFPDKQQEMREYIDDALAHFPFSDRLIYLKGAFLERIGKNDEAVGVMLDLLKRNPNNSSALNFVAYSWAESGQNLDRAEEFLKRALKFKPKEPFITDSLAWVYFKKGQLPKALKLLEEAYASRPDEAVIADHLGDVLVKMGRLEDAKRYYEIALKLGPNKEVDRSKLEQKLARLQGVLKSGCNGVDSRCARIVLDDSRTPAAAPSK